MPIIVAICQIVVRIDLREAIARARQAVHEDRVAAGFPAGSAH
jgi:hypothetical protein